MTTLTSGEGAAVPVIVGDATLYHADCRDVLRGLPDNSIDAVVTDPPYALVSIQKRFGKPGSKPAKDVYGRGAAGFMGKSWDTGEVAFSEEFWAEVLRVLKPGGHVVAFSGTRTYHRMAVAIEDAGFEIRDQCKWMHEDDSERDAFLASLNDEQRAQFIKLFEEHGAGQLSWDYGSGFPKSHDVSKAIDKSLGGQREVIGTAKGAASSDTNSLGVFNPEYSVTRPATDAARQWQGWGTALKPAWEPICLARKPLDGTVAENVLKHGTGALNIDGCRVPASAEDVAAAAVPSRDNLRIFTGDGVGRSDTVHDMSKGRWPANIVHDGSDEVLAAFPVSKSPWIGNPNNGAKGGKMFGGSEQNIDTKPEYRDAGSAARFFYCAKASRKDRDEGLADFETKTVDVLAGHRSRRMDEVKRPDGAPPAVGRNTHPTVKPTDLMRWLCRLVTPPGGVILDPFMGSGSTGKAALLEGFRFIGCEREDEYMPIAEARIAAALRPIADNDNQPVAAPAAVAANSNQPDLFGSAA